MQGKLQDKYPEMPAVVWKVLTALMDNPRLTAVQLAEQTGIKERQVRNHIAALRTLGLIERQGSAKTGFWRIRLEE